MTFREEEGKLKGQAQFLGSGRSITQRLARPVPVLYLAEHRLREALNDFIIACLPKGERRLLSYFIIIG